MTGHTILEVKNIYKSFGVVHALTDVSITLRAGEIHCVVGENGAGKSTLMNLIMGIYLPESGGISVEGEKVHFSNPIDAIKKGMSIVHQEIVNCPDITVAENIFMSEIISSKRAFVNYRTLNHRANDLLKNFGECGESINPAEKIKNLSISEQQIVEIVKALSNNAKVLIFDEPTSSLTEPEVEKLFKIISQLKSKGIGILYISHRMDEVFRLSDRITVLRDGCLIDTFQTNEVNKDMIVNKMIGRNLGDYCPPKSKHIGEPIMEVISFANGQTFNNISFLLRKHEILGFYGLIGAGRSELMKAVVGLEKAKSGSMTINGEVRKFKNYKQALSNGVVYLTEDRKIEGLFLRMDVQKNLTLMNLEAVSGPVFVNQKLERKEAKKYCDMMSIKCSGLEQIVGTLSGGNMQKILVAKALSIDPKIIIFDEPTRGIDVGSKAEIYRILRNLADKGIGIIVISSDLPEIIGLCDRIVVMYEGQISGEVTGEDMNEQLIIRHTSGLMREV